MRKQIISLALFFLFTCAILSLSAKSWAEVIIAFKGNTLAEDTMAGLITIPSMEIQVTCWGVAYSNDDLLVYDPSMRMCSLYEESLVPTLTDPDEAITLTDGTTATLRTVLEDETFVVIDTDTGIGSVDTMEQFSRSVPIIPLPSEPPSPPPVDTTPPDTLIISGPSGTITDNDVIFTYTGSDNKTSTSNLVYSYKLEAYDASWSSYTSSTSKSYSDLFNGYYTFQVKAKDQAGNVDPTPAFLTFTINYASLDSDGDGLPDDIENVYCTDANDADTDDDGILDGLEDVNRNGYVDIGETDPCNADSDHDGLNDSTEISIGTVPTNPDSDGDGFTDGDEVSRGTDPNDPNSHPTRAMPWIPLLLGD
jgi:hypothetical protein